MDFLYKNNGITIESEKKSIELLPDAVVLDGLTLDMAGEYEKGGFLAYAHEQNGNRIYQMRIEGETVGYVPTLVTDLTVEELEFLGDVDVLVMPTAKTSNPLIEKIEPRMVVTYGDTAHELATSLGIAEPAVEKYRLREADLSGEKMGCVVLG